MSVSDERFLTIFFFFFFRKDDDAIWGIFSFYVAQLCVTLTLTACPKRIVIGGGIVSKRPALLLPLIRKEFALFLNGYVRNEYVDNLETFIVGSEFGNDAGLLGALHLATLPGESIFFSFFCLLYFYCFWIMMVGIYAMICV